MSASLCGVGEVARPLWPSGWRSPDRDHSGPRARARRTRTTRALAEGFSLTPS